MNAITVNLHTPVAQAIAVAVQATPGAAVIVLPPDLYEAFQDEVSSVDRYPGEWISVLGQAVMVTSEEKAWGIEVYDETRLSDEGRRKRAEMMGAP